MTLDFKTSELPSFSIATEMCFILVIAHLMTSTRYIQGVRLVANSYWTGLDQLGQTHKWIKPTDQWRRPPERVLNAKTQKKKKNEDLS